MEHSFLLFCCIVVLLIEYNIMTLMTQRILLLALCTDNFILPNAIGRSDNSLRQVTFLSLLFIIDHLLMYYWQ